MSYDKYIEEDRKLITMGNLVRSMFTSVSILHLMLNDTKDKLNFGNSHWSIIEGNTKVQNALNLMSSKKTNEVTLLQNNDWLVSATKK